MKKLRIIQWYTGEIARHQIRVIAACPSMELVGAYVHHEEKNGVDAGEIAGIDPLGVRATNDMDEILQLRPDCVLYAPLLPNRQEVVRILESGINVVTPLNWFYPGKRDVADLRAACEKGGVTLHGTGIHPGGITERLPLSIAALTRAITHVRAEEFSDIRSYAATDVIRNIMLFGKTPQQAQTSPMLTLLTEGFSQSIEMIADALGFDLDPDIRSTHEVSVATAPIESPIGTIEPGQVAAQRFTWEGLVRGEPVATARTNWFMGQENLDPPWSFGPEGERFEIEVTGDPSIKTTFHGIHPESIAAGLERNPGIVATAIHCVSAIPYVCQADAGIKTYLDLPLVTGRAAAELGRRTDGP
ncbi:MAG: dihydrodipicolinate reductase [Deltaproteobacteria bacterium]